MLLARFRKLKVAAARHDTIDNCSNTKGNIDYILNLGKSERETSTGQNVSGGKGADMWTF